jgi:signal peptidase I
VFRWPGDHSQAWVKRVVGLPGDRIQMQDGQLVINDHRVARERLKDSLNAPAGSIPAPR